MIKTLPRKGFRVSSAWFAKSRAPLTGGCQYFFRIGPPPRPCRKGLLSRCFPSKTCQTSGSLRLADGVAEDVLTELSTCAGFA